MESNMKRQGDLLFTKVRELPKKLKKVQGGIILRGETTGHAHRLISGDVLKDKNGIMYLSVLTGGKVVHEEHNTISLPKGKYAVVRQREYQSKDMVRVVVD